MRNAAVGLVAAVALAAMGGARTTGGLDGAVALQDLLVANRALNALFVRAIGASDAEREARLDQLAESKQRLSSRLEVLRVPAEYEEVTALARLSVEADVRLLEAERRRAAARLEASRAQRELLAAVSRARGVPTRALPLRLERYREHTQVAAAHTAWLTARVRLSAAEPDLSRLRAQSRAHHARLDQRAFRLGLLPYRSGSPF